MTGAVPLLPLYAFMVWQGTSLPLSVPLRYFVIVQELYLNLYAKCTGSLHVFNM